MSAIEAKPLDVSAPRLLLLLWLCWDGWHERSNKAKMGTCRQNVGSSTLLCGERLVANEKINYEL